MNEEIKKEHKQIIDEWFINGFNGTINKNYGSKYYVYFLIDSYNNEIFYIGKGKNKRAENHVSEYKKGIISNHKKYQRIGNILSNKNKVLIHIYKNQLNEHDALRIEKQLIQNYKSKITNSQSGTLSKQEATIIWAKEIKQKMIPFHIWKLIKKRTNFEKELYYKQLNLLNNLISKKLTWD